MKQSVLLLGLIIMPLYAAKPIVVAHRGASAYAPENTLAAFKKAIEMGAPMIELDVHRAHSGEIVVHHDATLKDSAQKIKDLTWTQLQALGSKGQKIPLLAQVFDLVDKRIIINIELKSADTVQPVAQLIKKYIQEKQWPDDRFIISSFNHYWVKEFKKLLPPVKTAVIFECCPIGHAQIAVNAQAEYAILYYEWITPAFIADARTRGIKVFTYTVNDKNTAQEMVALGLDGIISNYPDILLP